MMHFFIQQILIVLALFICSKQDEYTTDANVQKASTIYTVSPNGNSFYIGGDSDMKIYRYEMLWQIDRPTDTYQTTHTQTIQVLAVSAKEFYLATGGQDYRIQVRIASNNTLVCTLWHYNQVKAMKFDPTNQKILYSAGLDDKIRKWNISTCKADAQIDPPQPVTSLSVNDQGTQIAFGTLYGDVGIVDNDLQTLTSTSNAHLFCVASVLYMNSDYYVTFGQQAALILWNDGTKITELKNIAPYVLYGCDFVIKARYNDTFRAISCATDNQQNNNRRIYLFKITNSSIQRFTDHGFSPQHTWVFTQHMDETSILFVIGRTNGLQYNFIYDQANQQCSPHTGRVPGQNICKLCWYFIQGCHFCDTSVSQCTVCMHGTYRSSGSCPVCSDDCNVCTSPTNCNQCGAGYEQIGSSGNCRTPTVDLDGCFQLWNSGNRCSKVTRGYYITGNNQRPCNSSNAGCLQCRSNNCDGCQTGYFLDNNNCRSCQSFITGCQACANTSDCIKCEVAFKYSGANLHCSDCHYSCKTCGQFYDTCLTCQSDNHRWLNGTQCQCDDGYYQNGTEPQCGLCSNTLNNCYLCDINTQCLQCHKGYYFVTSMGITQCETCNQYCETCNGTSSNCTACNQMTLFRQLVGSSCECITGYVSLSGSIPCYPCSTLIDGCNSCTNQTYCDSCDIGYYLNTYNASSRLCTTCPYYCPDCSQNGSTYQCNSCPPTRYLDDGECLCLNGYFDDNMTQQCELCSDVINNCDQCNNRRKCLSCTAGMYPDQSNSICSACRPTCLTCGPYFTSCNSCNSSQNRVLIEGQCACQAYAFQNNGICTLCETEIQNCNSCQNPYLCTGCKDGFTLQEDLKGCIDCAAEINGCQNCTSKTNCTVCKNDFTLINDRCRCDNSKYTSNSNWGECVNYSIPGLSSSLGMQIQIYQHQNNSINIFVRFRAKILLVLNQEAQDSIKLFLNQEKKDFKLLSIDNNRITLQTQINKTYEDANISVQFNQNVFYNQKLLTLGNQRWSKERRRLYYYEETEILPFEQMKNILKIIFYIFKWVFFGFTIIGAGHLIYPFVIFIQIIPLFLMLNLSLPNSLTAVLEAMLSFQVPSIVPIMQIQSDYTVYFPPINYDYYYLRDYIIFGKISDLILIVLINILTKFDQGILRMFPPGKIRRYLYQNLVRKGYSMMSLCILSLQPSFLLLSCVYINYSQWQVFGEVINYICCVFIFGFYLAYNFNHLSNLMGSKQLRNIDNENCYYDLNFQEQTANKPVSIILISQIWLMGALFLIDPIAYFIGSIIFLLVRLITQIKTNLYIGKIQFIMRVLENLSFLIIFIIIFVFYLAEQQIYLDFESCQKMGLAVIIFIFLYILFCIIQKIVFNLKLQTGWMKSKKVANQNNDVIFAQKIQQDDLNNVDQSASDTSYKNREFLNKNTSINLNSIKNKTDLNATNQSNLFKNTKNDSIQMPNNSNTNYNTNQHNNSQLLKPSYNSSKNNNSFHAPFKPPNSNSQSLYGNMNNHSALDPKITDQYFANKKKQQGQDAKVRIKSANTSKYARNHLQLRYKAQQKTLNKQADQFQDY